jgi:hypothetical protein
MTRKDDIIHYVIEAAIFLGFILLITSLRGIEGIPHTYFILGLLFFTVGTYQYGYRRGYGMGRLRGYDLGKSAVSPQTQATQ